MTKREAHKAQEEEPQEEGSWVLQEDAWLRSLGNRPPRCQVWKANKDEPEEWTEGPCNHFPPKA